MTILPDLSDLIIEQVSVTDGVTVTAHAASPTACCPCCGAVCQRVHSHYMRTLYDLPASGRPVHLKVQVRRQLDRLLARVVFKGEAVFDHGRQ